ncbi:NUDIX hydrolase [Terrimonas pollutisoli]|uniref:NUDIX hydrolase n=1 Tax=Terrimonas pollutisoli TaxID=3034147 RepID=UPI0023EBD987|nr:NUDIX domain-containing protein [Terrimonas sp. H1YJ31]
MQKLFKITVDCLVFAYDNRTNELKLLLIKRNNEPCKGQWALPGGFVKRTEEFVDTALRKLGEETGAKNIFLEQLNGYGLTDPSPQNRIVSIAFYALIKLDDFAPSDTNNHQYKWAHIKSIPALPFDHTRKVNDAIQRIKERAHVKPVVFNLLPGKFSLNQLQNIYEEIFDLSLDNRNFRRKAKSLEYLEPLDEFENNVSRRPGRLYTFNESKFKEVTDNLFIL